MTSFSIGVVITLLLGCGGGYYGYKRAGWQGLAAILVLVILTLVFLWLLSKTSAI